MKLKDTPGKTIRITFTDGETMTGFVSGYTSALDNTPEVASICIGHTEIYENEIQSIELI